VILLTDVPADGVVCCVCSGPHLALCCPLTQTTLAAAHTPELPAHRPHGTLASAKRERRAGGARAMCPACRAAWNADQRRHRARRAGRAVTAA
jgi:hypothetical protein